MESTQIRPLLRDCQKPVCRFVYFFFFCRSSATNSAGRHLTSISSGTPLRLLWLCWLQLDGVVADYTVNFQRHMRGSIDFQIVTLLDYCLYEH
jgi:hypothetical protein